MYHVKTAVTHNVSHKTREEEEARYEARLGYTGHQAGTNNPRGVGGRAMTMDIAVNASIYRKPVLLGWESDRRSGSPLL